MAVQMWSKKSAGEKWNKNSCQVELGTVQWKGWGGSSAVTHAKVIHAHDRFKDRHTQ